MFITHRVLAFSGVTSLVTVSLCFFGVSTGVLLETIKDDVTVDDGFTGVFTLGIWGFNACCGVQPTIVGAWTIQHGNISKG